MLLEHMGSGSHCRSYRATSGCVAWCFSERIAKVSNVSPILNSFRHLLAKKVQLSYEDVYAELSLFCYQLLLTLTFSNLVILY